MWKLLEWNVQRKECQQENMLKAMTPVDTRNEGYIQNVNRGKGKQRIRIRNITKTLLRELNRLKS